MCIRDSPDDPNKPDKELPPIEAEDEEKIAIPDGDEPGIMVRKTTEKTSYSAGETAIYKIEVINVGGVDLQDIEITETLENGRYVEQEGVTIEGTTAKVEGLKQGETITLTYEYPVPEGAETVENEVEVKAKAPNPDGELTEVTDEDDEIIDIGPKEADPTTVSYTHLDVYKRQIL